MVYCYIVEDAKFPKAFTVFTSVIRNFCDLFFFITLGLYYNVLWNKKVFHSNLTVLLFIFPLAYVVALSPAILRDIVQYFYILEDECRWFAISRWFDMVIDLGQYSASYNLLVLVAERAIATLYVSRYEYMCCKTPWLGCMLPLFQWAVCIPVLFINYYYEGWVITLEPLLYSTAISCVLAATVFAILPRVSEYVYKREFDEKFGNVNRYQSIENLRSATLLRRLVLLSVLFQLLCGGLYAMISLNTYTVSAKLLTCLKNLYYALLALIATLLNFVVVQSHLTLRKEFFRLTRLDKFRRQEKAQEISSVQGNRLDIPITDHSEFYFRSYKNSW